MIISKILNKLQCFIGYAQPVLKKITCASRYCFR